MSRLTPTILSDPDDLLHLAPAWTELLSRSASDEPMLSPVWLLPWWRVFGTRGLHVGQFHRDGRLVGLALLRLRRHWYAPGIPFRRLELLGTGEPEEDEVCSE